MRKFLTLTIIALLIIAGLGFWFWQRNTYSKEVLKLEILGPEEVTLGQESEYAVKYKNNGNFRLESPQLIFEPSSQSIDSQGQTFGRQILDQEKLGPAIYPGQEQTFSFKARLLGKEGQRLTAKAILTYQPKNLKARYESTTSFTTTIKSVPLTFDLDVPSKVDSGKDFVFRINYFSNVDYPLLGLRIQADYPSGFEFVQSFPKSLEKTEWEIPVLNKSKGGRVEISGKIAGEVGEAKILRFKLGMWREGEFILLKEAERGIELVKPSLFLRQEINGNPEYVARPGDWLHYEIYFKNVGEDDLNDLFLVSQLEGEAFEFFTLKSDQGNYQSGDNSLVFDSSRVAKLDYLAPLDEGKVDFFVRLKQDLGNVKNPILKNRIFISQVKQEFLTKISSKLEIVQKGYFQDEVFGNSGPLPPRVGEMTTYTITWQVKNYYSDVKDVKVKASLPLGAELTGRIFPAEETSKFSFDSRSREITWSVGDLVRGRGVQEPGPNLNFQIAFTPTVDQRGQVPEIVNSAEASGEDGWTDTIIKASAPALTIALPDDQSLTDGQKIVQ